MVHLGNTDNMHIGIDRSRPLLRIDMDNRKILILILGTASSVAVLFLIIYGGIVNNPALTPLG